MNKELEGEEASSGFEIRSVLLEGEAGEEKGKTTS